MLWKNNKYFCSLSFLNKSEEITAIFPISEAKKLWVSLEEGAWVTASTRVIPETQQPNSARIAYFLRLSWSSSLFHLAECSVVTSYDSRLFMYTPELHKITFFLRSLRLGDGGRRGGVQALKTKQLCCHTACSWTSVSPVHNYFLWWPWQNDWNVTEIQGIFSNLLENHPPRQMLIMGTVAQELSSFSFFPFFLVLSFLYSYFIGSWVAIDSSQQICYVFYTDLTG